MEDFYEAGAASRPAHAQAPLTHKAGQKCLAQGFNCCRCPHEEFKTSPEAAKLMRPRPQGLPHGLCYAFAPVRLTKCLDPGTRKSHRPRVLHAVAAHTMLGAVCHCC
eukprot:1152043-Pelagomonas_calceolata.AAC.7